MKLFEPYTFIKSGLTSVNRIVLAPMTNLQSNDDGTLGDDEYIWLTRRAKEGFGIIITCAAHVSKDGQGWRGELGIFDDVHLEGLAKLAKGIREQQSLAIFQLFHGGARSPEDVTGLQPWSASAHEMKVGSKMIDVRKGTKDDIHHIIQAFQTNLPMTSFKLNENAAFKINIFNPMRGSCYFHAIDEASVAQLLLKYATLINNLSILLRMNNTLSEGLQ